MFPFSVRVVCVFLCVVALYICGYVLFSVVSQISFSIGVCLFFLFFFKVFSTLVIFVCHLTLAIFHGKKDRMEKGSEPGNVRNAMDWAKGGLSDCKKDSWPNASTTT